MRDVGRVAHVQQLDARAIGLQRHEVQRGSAQPAAVVLTDRREKLRGALLRLQLIQLRQARLFAGHRELRDDLRAGGGRLRARNGEHIAGEAGACGHVLRAHRIDVVPVVLHEIRFIHAVHLNGRGREGSLRAVGARGADADDSSDLRRADQRHPQTVPHSSQQLFVARCITQGSFVRRRQAQRRVIGVDWLLACAAAAAADEAAARGEQRGGFHPE